MSGADWSYYGAAHRYRVHASLWSQERCTRRTRHLRAIGDEARLRHLAERGDRCAFIAILEVLVDDGRVGDLRDLAVAGDGRAIATLMELHRRRGAVDAIAADAELLGTGPGPLVDALLDLGRGDDAIAVLRRAAAGDDENRWHAHGLLLELLLDLGRIAEVEELARGGDRSAQRRLRQRADRDSRDLP